MHIVDREPTTSPAALVGDRVNRKGRIFNRSDPVEKHCPLPPGKNPTRQYYDTADYQNSKRQKDFAHFLGPRLRRIHAIKTRITNLECQRNDEIQMSKVAHCSFVI